MLYYWRQWNVILWRMYTIWVLCAIKLETYITRTCRAVRDRLYFYTVHLKCTSLRMMNMKPVKGSGIGRRFRWKCDRKSPYAINPRPTYSAHETVVTVSNVLPLCLLLLNLLLFLSGTYNNVYFGLENQNFSDKFTVPYSLAEMPTTISNPFKFRINTFSFSMAQNELNLIFCSSYVNYC